MIRSIEGFSTALSRLIPVRVARTEAEREAIYRLRYRVYVEEKNDLRFPGIDHEKRQLKTEADELPGTTLFYTGTAPKITGTVRVRVWQPSTLPSDVRERYSLDRFPGVDSRTLCHTGLLMVDRSMRGTANALALSTKAGEETIATHGVELMFTSCAPGLLNSYSRLGLRPYGARLLSEANGLQIPVAYVTADLDHARRNKTLWYPTLRSLARSGKLPTREPASLLPPFAHGGVVNHPSKVVELVRTSYPSSPTFFLGALKPKTRDRLVQGGVLLVIEPKVDLVVEGFVNRDLFIVLEGQVELLLDGVACAQLGPGELLGEVAYFSERGRRSAGLRTRTACRVLPLRQGQLRRFVREHPADGVEVYEALGKLLAARLAGWGPAGRRGDDSQS